MNLLIGTRVPAVNSTNRLLVYFQDVYDSIPESLYEGSRANGTEKNVIGKAKLGSPVAATSKELNNGTPTRSLPTTLEADDTTAAWAVPSSKLPYSGIAAVFLAGTDAFQLRSYVQKSDNTIQEYMWNGNGWEEGTNLGTASPVLVSEPPPSAILTTMAQASEIHRIWFQTDDLRRVQRAYDPHKGWYPNLSAIFDKAPPRTAIAATSFGAGNSSIYMRIFLSTWTTLSGRSAGTTARAITTSQPSLQRGSFANNGPDLGLYFQNGTYCPPSLSYSLRQPDWMSKAELATLAAGMPSDDLFEAFEYVQDEGLRFLEAQRASKSETTKSSSGPIVRVWFYFPSLSTREKRNDLVNHAPDYSLTGFVLAGKPGVLCLEGASADIDAYMSFIKTHSWGDIPSHQKKVSERYRETKDVQRVFSGMEEITDSLGERSGHRANRGDMQALETWLQTRGLHEAFDKVIF
ncbi:hypothetical protein CNMCM6069_006244 [Aspergillus lentulus]|nr:hypothetical protein CNMCM6069_006244 [Aspergillus lentulus]